MRVPLVTISLRVSWASGVGAMTADGWMDGRVRCGAELRDGGVGTRWSRRWGNEGQWADGRWRVPGVRGMEKERVGLNREFARCGDSQKRMSDQVARRRTRQTR